MAQHHANAKTTILFSCVGSTDPVRGLRDGGMVHIARKFRPAAIHLFFTKEFTGWDQWDSRIKKTADRMRAYWGYTPEITRTDSGIEDPSNLESLYEPMRGAFEAFADRYPDAEILVNLSSGTPQMEIILSQLVLETRWRIRGIQVKNPEGRSGSSLRTNSQNYRVDEELRGNLDDGPECPDRCTEPTLFAIRRERNWREVRSLLEQRDYAAVAAMPDCLPPDLLDIVRHLSERDSLQTERARELAAKLPPELNLYPVKPGGTEDAAYWEVADYWLMMKNMLLSGRYSDFLLRLSVLALYLEERILTDMLSERGAAYDALTIPSRNGKDRELSMDALNDALPDLYAALCEAMEKDYGITPQNGRSVFLYSRILRCMKVPKKKMGFLNICDNLTGPRNDVAHRLRAVTKEEFRNAASMDVDKFIKRAEFAMQTIYPHCDPAVFGVHERCVRYIEEHR